MFEEISEIAKAYKCVFTLYVDDMTFSSTTPFNKDKLCSDIDKILRKYNHKPKYKKVRYYSKNEAKPITGTVVTSNNRLDIPNALQNKVFNGFNEVKEFATGEEMENGIAKKIASLHGQVQAAKNIDSERFREDGRIVKQMYNTAMSI